MAGQRIFGLSAQKYAQAIPGKSIDCTAKRKLQKQSRTEECTLNTCFAAKLVVIFKVWKFHVRIKTNKLNPSEMPISERQTSNKRNWKSLFSAGGSTSAGPSLLLVILIAGLLSLWFLWQARSP